MRDWWWMFVFPNDCSHSLYSSPHRCPWTDDTWHSVWTHCLFVWWIAIVTSSGPMFEHIPQVLFAISRWQISFWILFPWSETQEGQVRFWWFRPTQAHRLWSVLRSHVLEVLRNSSQPRSLDPVLQIVLFRSEQTPLWVLVHSASLLVSYSSPIDWKSHVLLTIRYILWLINQPICLIRNGSTISMGYMETT